MQIGSTLGYTMCLNLKTSVLPPLNEALSGQIDCDSNGVQKVSYLDAVPFSVPLLAVLFTCPWYLGRRRTVTDPQG